MTTRSINSGWIGKTFDDFLMRPQKGINETRQGISLRSNLAGELKLELPLISSNMDSVTGARMAEAIALEGGLGVIHRGQSIDRQVTKVTEVKRSYSAVIENPHRLPMGATIREAKRFARQRKITGILIETSSGSGILAGLLSNRDIPWTGDVANRKVEEFMTPVDQLHTHSPNIKVDDAERVLFEKRIERLPLVDEKNRIHGLITRKDVRYLRERPYASKDDKGHLLVAAAIGARGDYVERAHALLEAGADCFFIDIAHGHSSIMQEAVETMRKEFGNIPLLCGNVATYEGALFMKEIGADAIKVGVGPGRGCRTRLETSAGVPQLQAIREAWCAVGDEIPIIADGGVRFDKDIFMALICGASTVMLGSALSGTDESPGRVIEDPATHTKKKMYRGMTSPEAVLESMYEEEDNDAINEALQTPPEGQEFQVAYKGAVRDILHRIRGHLRSGVSYAGEISLENARAKILPEPLDYLVTLSESSRRESYER